MGPAIAFVYYRENYLFGVARPGALVYDGVHLALYANDLSQVWSAPVGAVTVKKGWGSLTLSIDGAKKAIITAVGGNTSPNPSPKLQYLLDSGEGIPQAPSVESVTLASGAGLAGLGAYAQGQGALRDFFEELGVLSGDRSG